MPQTRRRTVVSLKIGSRIGVVLAALLILFAAYQFWVPIDITGNGGVQFNCGSVFHPPTSLFQRGTCGGVVDRQRVRMTFAAIAGLMVAAGSIYAFGVERRYEEIAEAPDTDDEAGSES